MNKPIPKYVRTISMSSDTENVKS